MEWLIAYYEKAGYYDLADKARLLANKSRQS